MRSLTFSTVLVSLFLADDAPAQCTAWQAGFHLPGVERTSSSRVDAATTFDPGSGPELVIGGTFSGVGGIVSKAIAAWDGTTWHTLPGASVVEVHALATFDDGNGMALYAGGSLNAQGSNGIARWDGQSWSGLGSGVSGIPYAMCTFDDGNGLALYVGGRFNGAGATPAFSVARWDGAAWSALGAGLTSNGGSPVGPSVRALAVHDDGSGPTLYAAGDFEQSGATQTLGVARWNGSTWTQVGVGMLPVSDYWYPHTLASYDDGTGSALYCGGVLFDPSTQMQLPGLQRWDGSTWSTVGTAGVVGSVQAAHVFDDGSGKALYCVGGFGTVDGQPARSFARWNGSWTTFGATGPNHGLAGAAAAQALATYEAGGEHLLITGGRFDHAGDVVAFEVAGWNGASWRALSDGEGLNGIVEEIVVGPTSFEPTPTTYACGDFTTAGSANANHVARWNGAEWSALGSGFNLRANALAFLDDGSGTSLYAGGDFTGSPGSATYLGRVARWDGATWQPVGNGLDGPVYDLAVFDEGQGPRLFAGGRFTTAAGVTARGIAKWTGTSWVEAAGGITGGPQFREITCMQVFDDGSGPSLFLGGAFNSIGSVLANRIAKWNGTSVSALAGGLSAKVFTLGVHDDGNGPALYASGTFASADGLPADHIVRWDGSSWSAPPGLTAFAHVLLSYDAGDGNGAQLYAGGDFDQGLARLGASSWQSVDGGIEGAIGQESVHALAAVPPPSGTWPALMVGGLFVKSGGNRTSNVALWSNACACNGTSYCTAGTSASGCQATISSTGTASRSFASGFVVTVASVEGLRDGVIFFGTSGAQAIPWGNGTSFRCVAPPTVRTGVQDGVGTGGACDNVYAIDFNAWMSTHAGLAPDAGETAYLQAWYRDPGNGSNKATSFSDALRVVVCP